MGQERGGPGCPHRAWPTPVIGPSQGAGWPGWPQGLLGRGRPAHVVPRNTSHREPFHTEARPRFLPGTQTRGARPVCPARPLPQPQRLPCKPSLSPSPHPRCPGRPQPFRARSRARSTAGSGPGAPHAAVGPEETGTQAEVRRQKGFREAHRQLEMWGTGWTAVGDSLLDTDGSVSNKIRARAKNNILPSGKRAA